MADPDPPAQRRYPTAKCPVCPAPIIWAFDARGGRVALDVEPLTPGPPAGSGRPATKPPDVILTSAGPGLAPRARQVASQADLFGRAQVWRRHVTTCPYPDQLRHQLARRAASRRNSRSRR